MTSPACAKCGAKARQNLPDIDRRHFVEKIRTQQRQHPVGVFVEIALTRDIENDVIGGLIPRQHGIELGARKTDDLTVVDSGNGFESRLRMRERKTRLRIVGIDYLTYCQHHFRYQLYR